MSKYKYPLMGMIAAFVVTIASCGTITSLFGDSQMTKEQIVATQVAKEKEADALTKAEAQKAVALAQSAQMAHEAEVARITRQYAAKLRDVSVTSESTKAAIQDELQDKLDDAGVALSNQVAATKIQFDSTVALREVEITKSRSLADAAIADINNKQAAQDRWLHIADGVLTNPAVGAAAGASPLGPLFGVLGSLLGAGGLVGMFGARKETKVVQEDRDTVLEDARSLVNAFTIARGKNPALAAAMNESKADLLQHMSDGAYALIKTNGSTT